MKKDPIELADEGIWLSDLLDLVFGAGMIIAGLAVIIMLLCARAGWGANLLGLILFLFCLAVGGMMMKDALENSKKRKQKGL